MSECRSCHGGLAQSVECVVRNDEAAGSKPAFSSFYPSFLDDRAGLNYAYWRSTWFQLTLGRTAFNVGFDLHAWRTLSKSCILWGSNPRSYELAP